MSISCEIPSETMSMCIHGVPVKFQCGRCEDKHRITLLESQVKTLTEMYKDLSCKVAGFDDHRIRQIDENRKIYRRVDEIEYKSVSISFLDSYNQMHDTWKIGCETLINNIHERIDKLESLNKQCFDASPIKQIEERFEKIEGLLEFTRALLNGHIVASKKPHKCPVCEGSKELEVQKNDYLVQWQTTKIRIDALGRYFQPCGSCEGKGIIWG